MSIETARSALLWCTIINYVVLLVWFGLFLLPHEWMYDLWARWFKLTREQFDAINFAGIVGYKTAIIFFNLVPYIALLIVA